MVGRSVGRANDPFRLLVRDKNSETARDINYKKAEIQYRVPNYLSKKLVPQLKTYRFIYNMLLKYRTNIYLNTPGK